MKFLSHPICEIYDRLMVNQYALGYLYCPIDTDMPVQRLEIIMETLKPAAILVDEVNANKNSGSAMQFLLPVHYHTIVERSAPYSHQ